MVVICHGIVFGFLGGTFASDERAFAPSTTPSGSISYVKDHWLLTYAAYRIQHLESRCKDTTQSEGVERFRYFLSLIGAIWCDLAVSVTFLL